MLFLTGTLKQTTQHLPMQKQGIFAHCSPAFPFFSHTKNASHQPSCHQMRLVRICPRRAYILPKTTLFIYTFHLSPTPNHSSIKRHLAFATAKSRALHNIPPEKCRSNSTTRQTPQSRPTIAHLKTDAAPCRRIPHKKNRPATTDNTAHPQNHAAAARSSLFYPIRRIPRIKKPPTLPPAENKYIKCQNY